MSRAPSPAPLERHYTTREAARIIGCSSGTLRNMRVVDRGPRWVVTGDGTIRYAESALRAWLGGTPYEAAA